MSCSAHEKKSQPAAFLLQRAKAGQPDAVTALLQPFWEPVFRMAYRVTGHTDDAEDLRQEAFLRVMRSLPSYRGDCSFATWVYRITGNLCASTVRRHPRHSQKLDSVVDADPATGPEETALCRDLDRRIRDGILGLPTVCREAVLLRVMADLSYEEVAEVLNVSVGTARTRVYRGITRLREQFRWEDHGERAR